MKIKLDENLPLSVRGVLTADGHDVDTVQDEGLAGANDLQVLAAANAAERLLITLDRGLGDLRAYPPGSHAGIVVLRVDDQSAKNVRTALTDLVASGQLPTLTGR